jgi:hypothetical protein
MFWIFNREQEKKELQVAIEKIAEIASSDANIDEFVITHKDKEIQKLNAKIADLEYKLEYHKSVLFEGQTRTGKEIQIQFWEEDHCFYVVEKATKAILFRTNCLTNLLVYKKSDLLNYVK